MQSRQRLQRLIAVVTAFVTAVAILTLLPEQAQAAGSGTTTYTATDTIPVPPASNYAGAGGGDGWAVALSVNSVFNVFHHSGQLTVACHQQADAASCWDPKTVTDASGNNFATSGQPSLWLNPVSNKLYVYATRSVDSTGGVVCIDTTQALNPNPFCGFTALTAVGDSVSPSGISPISDAVSVNNKWYAFNYTYGSNSSGSRNRLLCFDQTTLGACGGQPFSLDIGSGVDQDSDFPAPSIAAFENKIIVPIDTDAGSHLLCFDPSKNTCSGSWPIEVSSGAANGAAFPLLSTTGKTTGFCLPNGAGPCFDLNGRKVDAPKDLFSAITTDQRWNGPAVTIGSRVFVPNGTVDQVECYDYSANASCENFPKSFTDLSYLYTVNPDPQRPTCLWVNADGGAAQIQNFDAYTGGQCGRGPIRVLASNVVAPEAVCTPLSWTSLQVQSPAPTTYTSGSVAFRDSNNHAIPSTPDRPLDATGTASLSGADLTSGAGLPQFLITLSGSNSTPTSVVVELTWTGKYDPTCFGSTNARVDIREQGGARNGSEHSTTCSEGDPVNCASGEFWQTYSDLQIPGRGENIDFSRTYTSGLSDTDSALGFGWSNTYDTHVSFDKSGNATVHEGNGAQTPFLATASGFEAPPRVLAKLAKNNDGTLGFTRNADSVTYVFSSDGRLVHETDRNHETTNLNYVNDHLASVIDPSGRTLNVSWDGGHITGISDPANRSVHFAYDDKGNLVSVIDTMGKETRFTYDAHHKLTSFTNQNGATTSNTYDASGRVTQQKDGLGRITKWSFSGDPVSSDGGITTMTSPNGNKTTYRYVDFELVAETKAADTPFAATTTYSYDPSTLGVTAVTDPNNHTRSYTYDALGNATSASNGAGNTSTFTYNEFNEPLTQTNPLGVTTSYHYDDRGNLLSITTPIGDGKPDRTISGTYANATHPGDITSIIDADGNTTHIDDDQYGNITAMTDALGHTSTITYDIISEPISSVSARGNEAGVDRAKFTTRFAYDAAGHQTTITDPLGHSETRTYDGVGNMTSLTDANGHTSVSTFDLANQVTNSRDADGAGIISSYDQNGNIVTHTDTAGNTTSYKYDQLDHPTSSTDPIGRVTQFSYDKVGNRIATTDARGITTTFAYDAADRMIGTHYSDGTPAVEYVYDATGVRSSMHDGTGTTTYRYDKGGRLTKTTDGAGNNSVFGLDGNGNRTSITYPNGKTVTQTFDAANHLTAIKDWLSHVNRYAYDADGNAVTASYGNGTTTTQTFDNANQLLTITAKHGSDLLQSLAYTRDANSNVINADPNGLSAPSNYSYTPGQRLASDNDKSYSYDNAGRITKTNAGTLQYDGASQLQYVNGIPSFTYDQAGNRTEQSANQSSSTPPCSLCLMNNSAPNALKAAGIGSISATGAIAIDSSSSASVSVRDSSRVTASEVKTHGKGNVTGGATVTPRLVANAPYTPSPLTGGSTPPTSAQPASVHIQGGSTSTLQPGHYSSIFVGGGAKVQLAPGTYVVDGPMTVTESATLTGTNVALFFTHSNVSFTGGAHVRLSGTDTTPVFNGNDNGANFVVDNAAAADVEGSINLPSTTFTFTGRGRLHVTKGIVVAGTLSMDNASSLQIDSNGFSLPASPPTPVAKYTYDGADRLIGFASDTSHATYAYNGDGVRTSKNVNNTATTFTWDYSGNIPQLLDDGSNSYIYGPDNTPLEQIDSSGHAQWFHHDQLGSTRELTDENGIAVAAYTYDAFGQTTGGVGHGSTPLRFAGQYTDSESGLIYLRARSYDPATAQFISVDPLNFMTHSPYAYAQNNPVNIVDLTGAWPKWGQVLGTVSLVTGVVAIGLTLTGVGAPVAAVLEGVSVVTGVAAAVVDCSEKVDVQCGIDIAAAVVPAAGLGFKAAGKLGLLSAESGELIDTVLGIHGLGFAIPGTLNSWFPQDEAKSHSNSPC